MLQMPQTQLFKLASRLPSLCACLHLLRIVGESPQTKLPPPRPFLGRLPGVGCVDLGIRRCTRLRGLSLVRERVTAPLCKVSRLLSSAAATLPRFLVPLPPKPQPIDKGSTLCAGRRVSEPDECLYVVGVHVRPRHMLTQRHRIPCRALPLWRALPSRLGVCVRALLMESHEQTACVGVVLVDSHAFAK